MKTFDEAMAVLRVSREDRPIEMVNLSDIGMSAMSNRDTAELMVFIASKSYKRTKRACNAGKKELINALACLAMGSFVSGVRVGPEMEKR
jgi:hypothetical protein